MAEITYTHHKLLALRIIDETIEYYRTHPRATRHNGRVCPVGRCMADLEHALHLYGDEYGDLPIEHLDDLIEGDLLRPEYRGLPIEFWDQLIAHHDYEPNWTENEHGGSDLTEQGLEDVNDFRRYVVEGAP